MSTRNSLKVSRKALTTTSAVGNLPAEVSIAWEGHVPAGGVWLNWGTAERHGFGHVAEGIPELALAVEPRFRSQGVGTMLIDAATNLAREMGAPGISLSVAKDNDRAHRLYLHLGFEPVGESDGHIVLVKRFKAAE